VINAAAVLVAGFAATAAPAAAGPTCTVPGSHGTFAAALADAGCSVILLAAGDHAASLTIDRDVTITGAGAGTRLLGAPGDPVLTIGGSADVHLESLRMIADTAAGTGAAFVKPAGSTVGMSDVAVSTFNSSSIFADGFESGTVDAWSGSTGESSAFRHRGPDWSAKPDHRAAEGERPGSAAKGEHHG